MQETVDWQNKFLSDGLHLTPQGNTVVYDEVVRVFREAGYHLQICPLIFLHHSHIDDKNPERAFQIQC